MSATSYDLTFDGVAMPPPAKEGIHDSDELLWSSNAGRTADGTFVGDIIGEKQTLEITWNELTNAQFALIKSHISRVGHPFITVKYTDPTGARKTFTGYTDGAKGTIVLYTPDGRIAGVTLSIVEK